MHTVASALALVLAESGVSPPIELARADALGLILAEDIVSDIDSPPHDKSIVDGYAVVASDLASGDARLEIIEEIVAGNVPNKSVTSGRTSRIMTGAPLPTGSDAVVMLERAGTIEPSGSGLGFVELRETGVRPRQNIMVRGVSIRRGDTVLSAGGRLRPVEIGVLAEVGRSRVRVIPRPTLAILSTGDELVAPDQVPGPGQIRNSNGSLLVALATKAGASPHDLGVARDEKTALRAAIEEGLESDFLVLSGGVSAGVLDLVPSVLAELGVNQVLHKVQLKPGKPLWFGTRAKGPAKTLVFGLPGNPVSGLVCFELFVRPAIARVSGTEGGLPRSRATLASPFSHRGDRPTYHPARLETDGDTGTRRVEPLTWRGSGDLRTLVQANALACFPAGGHDYNVGDTLEVLSLD